MVCCSKSRYSDEINIFILRLENSAASMLWTNVLLLLLFLGRAVVADNLALLLGTLRNYQRIGCDFELVTLKCPHGTTISVQLANYGKVSGEQRMCTVAGATTPTTTVKNTSCQLPPAMQYSFLQIVVEACQKKRQCKFQATPKIIGADPCPGVGKFIQVDYKCRPYEFRSKVACENEAVQLKCNPHSRIAIYSASYGRTEYESVQCPQPQGVPEETCLVSYASETVMQICHGKRSCNLSADVATFGNPCRPASRMYLKVVYTCVPRKVLKERYEDGPLEDEITMEGSRDSTDYDDFDGYESIDDFFRESAAFSPPPNLDSNTITNVTESINGVDPQIKDNSNGKKRTLNSINSSTKKPRVRPKLTTPLVYNNIQSDIESSSIVPDDTNCTINVYTSSKTNIIGFITEWIRTYSFMKRNQEKLYLYLILSITSGLLIFFAIIIARLMIQKYRAVREAKFYSSHNDHTLPHGFGDENCEIDADINLATTSAPIPNISLSTQTYSTQPVPPQDTVQFSDLMVESDTISTVPRSFNRYGNNQQYYFG